MSPDDHDRMTLHLLYLAVVTLMAAGVSYGALAAITLPASGHLPPLRAGVWGMGHLPWHTTNPAGAFDPTVAELLPSPAVFWAALALMVAAGLVGVGWVWWRIDLLKGRKVLAARWYDPRSRITPRAFARPRDLRHLPAGIPDSWTTIRLDRRTIGTPTQTHILLIAPTRSGKTTGPVTTWAREHQGPAVITSTKTDIIHLTAPARAKQGPIWIYAPGLPPDSLPIPGCGWTPLDECRTWEGAQLTAGWLAQTPTNRQVTESDGGRFYTQEATRILAALMHAATLTGHTMSTVNHWLRREDPEPLRHLRTHHADQAAAVLDAFRKTDSKPRTLTIATCGQLISAYEYQSIAATDHTDFTPNQLLHSNGTLYLIAPESRQDLIGPLFSALLGSVYRTAETHALTHGPLNPTLRIILDETSRLAATDNLPALLSISAGWGIRIVMR